MKPSSPRIIITSILLAFILSCSGGSGTGTKTSSTDDSQSTMMLLAFASQLVERIIGPGTAPVLEDLVITGTDAFSITIAQPTFSNPGNPTPTVKAFIGVTGQVIKYWGYIINSIEGPIDVSRSGYTFENLTPGTTYTIFVVADNEAGYSVREILQSTSQIAPVMNSLSIAATGSTSIILAQPTFSTFGNPAPTVEAYIGLSNTISVSGSTVTGALQGPVDVSYGEGQFYGLTPFYTYKLIVVAKNDAGYSVQQIVQSTTGIAPFLNSLAVTGYDTGSITIAKPTFSTSGNPTPSVEAYIGLTGSVSVSGSTVSGSLQGPIDVSTGGYQFSDLSIETSYTIVVVAKNSVGYSVRQIVQSTEGLPKPPVMNNLSVSTFDTTSISIAQPTFSTAGTPKPTVLAYIGLSDTIAASGSTVSGATQGPVDVSSGGYQFSGLSINTAYRIIVVAENTEGYSVQQITQSTSGIAPVLNSLSVPAFDDDSITVAQPTFSTAGNPAPTVLAYIGVSGTITVAGSVVTGSIQGPVDVSTGGYQFSGLTGDMTYRIIVVAQNGFGYSVQQITQGTEGIAPVLNSLSISSFDYSSITIAQPTLSTAGNPAPTVRAFIGYNGVITVISGIVYGYLQDPVDVSAGGCQFTGLNDRTSYTVVVIAKNSIGYSVQQINQTTASMPAAPVLRSLSISSFDTSSITLAQPAFSTAGNPTPLVLAFIGLNGTITVSGSTVTGSIQGPIDVSSGGHQFSGLSTNTTYKVVVVAINASGYSVQEIIQSTAGIKPVLNSLVISASDSSSITLARPTFSTAGNPAPTVRAYIGYNGVISVMSGIVLGYLQGPRDVSTGSYQFTGLPSNTAYRIIVVAENTEGYSVQEIVQSTAGVAPVMNNLSVSSYDKDSITIARPTFSVAGNPAPTVRAYIGLESRISVSGTTVSGASEGPVDVSAGGYQFSGLGSSLLTGYEYEIIVVAQNSVGYSVKTVIQKTRCLGLICF